MMGNSQPPRRRRLASARPGRIRRTAGLLALVCVLCGIEGGPSYAAVQSPGRGQDRPALADCASNPGKIESSFVILLVFLRAGVCCWSGCYSGAVGEVVDRGLIGAVGLA